MQKLTVWIISIVILTVGFTACSIDLPQSTTTTPPTEEITIPQITEPATTETPTQAPPYIEAASSFVYDVKNQKMIAGINLQQHIAPASITKLLTACLALEYFRTDEAMTAGNEVFRIQPNSSQCFILPGHKLTVLDILYGLLIHSGNDAAYTIAVNVANRANPNANMTEDEAINHFIIMMNDYAYQIGMKNSQFTTPDGYDADNQYVTAQDILALALKAKEFSTINMITGTLEKYCMFLTGETITWRNTNLFLDPQSVYYSPYVNGMKTGSTLNAGTCLLTSYNDGTNEFVIFVAGCTSDEARYVATQQLINWALN